MSERWRLGCIGRAYAEAFHHQHIQAVDLQQVQVDEIRLKIQQQGDVDRDGVMSVGRACG